MSKFVNNKVFFLISLFSVVLLSCESPKPIDEAVKPAYGVLERLLGDRAEDFVLQKVAKENDRDFSRTEVREGKIYISGSSNTALCYGAYSYLKEIGACLVSWEGNRVDLPNEWPEYSEKNIISPFNYRMYMNACAFGYATVWWNWKRWEQELDWMALHGVNMPTALEGQEAVWQKIWLRLGMSQDDLDLYFSGPAFLPWHRMGNLSSYMGPLPQSWIENRKELQKNILIRMHELDMSPVVQAFSGYVPKKMIEIFPDAKIRAMKSWGGNIPGTYMLDPKDSLFNFIGKTFIKEYTKEYGAEKFYLADPFNEMLPPVSEENKIEELAEYGQAVYNSIKSGNTEGVWVMQGWLFGHSKDFWTEEAAISFLSRIPNDKMFIQDYGNDRYITWKRHKAFYGKQWLHGFVHGYGCTNAVFGDFKYYNTLINDSLMLGEHGNIQGIGTAAEGLNNNSVVYEFIYDLGWQNNTKNIDSWLKQYCIARYGKSIPAAEEAWLLLEEAVYRTKYWKMRWWKGAGTYIHNKRPSLVMGELEEHIGDQEKLKEAILLLISCADENKENPLFIHDIIEFTRHYWSMQTDLMIAEACREYPDGNKKNREALSQSAFKVLETLDTLIAAQPFNRLSTWLEAAKNMATTPEEERLYLQNARTQITIWGGVSLHDYAAKEWSGLYRDFYIPRWRMFFEEIQLAESNGKSFDEEAVRNKIREWEEEWTLRTDIPSDPQTTNPIEIIKRLMNQ